MRSPFARPDPATYKREIKQGLDRAFGAAPEQELELGTARLIVFSDHHKGARDGADDFQRCERAYNAALAYYLASGHRLVALGDVEELWECAPAEVIGSYPQTLGLEAEFHKAGRYDRFFGNHDDLWGEPRQVSKRLGNLFPHLSVREALKLRVTSQGSTVGLLFLAHGHQGTRDSDRFSGVSRLFVRHVWRPLQRKLGMASTTPAVDWELRGAHDTAMFEWARDHGDRPVLIAGHTHGRSSARASRSSRQTGSRPRSSERCSSVRRPGRDRGSWRGCEPSWSGPVPRSDGFAIRLRARSRRPATSTPAAARSATVTSPGSRSPTERSGWFGGRTGMASRLR